MALHHVSLATGPAHYKEMRDFYIAILKPLGYEIFMEKNNEVLGMAPKFGAPDFWLHCGGTEIKKFNGDVEKRPAATHLAFTAKNPAQVRQWYDVALKAGGISNGKPGEREYVKGYYAAYIIDPLGHNVELVHFDPLFIKALKAAPYVITAVLGVGAAIGAQYVKGFYF